MEFLLVKTLHILSATLILGTGIGSAFYMFMANRSKDIPSIYFATRNVVIADWIFTTSAAVIQLITGLYMVFDQGYEFKERWIYWGLILYFFVGACWLPVVWMQIKMRDMAKAALETKTELPPLYWQMDGIWILLGTIAFPAVIVIFYLMVFKPL